MAVHTYIGARYVPKFVGVYDPTQSYEALDVVDNGSGTSYIAKIPTPAGTPLTDPDHWFLYGASSGAIIQLQNDMLQAQHDILALDGEIQTLEDDLERNLLIIGNSYVSYGCADVLAADFEHSYKYTEGGVGFVTYTNHSSTFETLLDAAIADANLDNDKITDIIFVSAVGDGRAYDENSSYVSSLTTTITSMKTKIAASFINCKNVRVTHAESRNVGYVSGLCKYATLYILHQIFKRIFDKSGFEYIGWSGFNSFFVSADFQADHYHPSVDGARAIGERIRQSWNNSLEYKTLHGQGNVTAKYTATATINVEYDISPDDVSLHIRRINCTNGGAITLARNDMLVTGAAFPIPIPCPAVPITMIAPLLNNSNGTVHDFLNLGMVDDAGDGIFGIQRTNTATVLTAGDSQLYSVGLQNLSYKIYG